MIDLSSLLRKDCVRIGLFGLGRSTLGAMEYLLSELKYKDVKITLRSDGDIPTRDIPKRLGECRLMCRTDALRRISEDILIVSPGVRADRAEFLAAREKGVVITSDAELFFSRFHGESFGITGSDGKSTTSRMTHLLLGGDVKGVRLAGNIGAPMSPLLLDTGVKKCVIELSSFMLNQMTPTLGSATVTNITPNHLNWHKSLEEYISAKKNILINARERVLWADSSVCRSLIEELGADVIISFNKDKDELSREYSARCYVTRDKESILLNGKRLLSIQRLKALGDHTVKNFMNAVAMTVGCVDADTAQGIADSYQPLPHRCESVGIFQGNEYINSSIDSTPQRTATTLSSLARSVTLILCGRGKGLSYEPLTEALDKFADKIVLGGEIGDEVYGFLLSFGFDTSRIYRAGTLRECVKIASDITQSGTVLLSPSATSFDEFSSFEERGEAFKRYIKQQNGL